MLLSTFSTTEFTAPELDQAVDEWERLQFGGPLFVAPTDVPKSDWWQITHAASDASNAETKKVLKTAKQILDAAPKGQIRERIDDGDVAGALALFDWKGYENSLTGGFTEAFTKIGIRSGSDTAIEIGKGIDYDESNFIKDATRGARIVAARVTKSTRRATSDALRRLIDNGSLSANEVRLNIFSLLGLDPTQANAGVNKIIAQREAGDNLKKVREATDKFAENAREVRAERVARFENLNAAQTAQEDAVKQHVDVRALNNVVKVWVIVPDDSTCPICNRLRGQRQIEGDSFADPFTGLTYIGPPAHQSCRCGLRYFEARKDTRVAGVFVVDIRVPDDDGPVMVAREELRARIFHQAGKHDQSTHGKGKGKAGGAVSAKDAENAIRETEVSRVTIKAEAIQFNEKQNAWIIRGTMSGDVTKSEAKEKFQEGLDQIGTKVGKENVQTGKIKVSERGHGTSRFVSRSVIFGVKVKPLDDAEIEAAVEAFDSRLTGRKSSVLPVTEQTKKKLIDLGRIKSSESLEFHQAGKHDQSTHGKKKGPPVGQVSFEAQPSTSVGIVPGIQDASFAEKRGYMNDTVGAMSNPETGAPDELLEASGLEGDPPFEVVGVWQGTFNPGMQVEVDKDASTEDVEAYAASVGKTLKQDAVGYHRPFFDGDPGNDQGAEIELGKTISRAEMGNLYGEMQTEFGSDVDGVALVASKKGVRALNFTELPPAEFQQKLGDATGRAIKRDVSIGTFDFDGGLVENDWKVNPNGEGYNPKIGKGRSALSGAVDRVNERVGKVNDKWKDKFAPEVGETAASERTG